MNEINEVKPMKPIEHKHMGMIFTSVGLVVLAVGVIADNTFISTFGTLEVLAGFIAFGLGLKKKHDRA